MKFKTTDNTPTAIILMILGVAFILFPADVLNVLLRIIGGGMLVYELFNIWRLIRFSGSLAGGLLGALFVSNAAIVIIIGAVLVANPLGAVRFIEIALGIYLIVSAAVPLISHISEGGVTGSFNIVKIVVRTLTILLGIWLISDPGTLADIAFTIIGVSCIVEGIQLLFAPTDKGDGDTNFYTDDFQDKT